MATQRPHPRWRKAAGWLLVALVLGGVFLTYLDPHAVADLSNRIWGCF
ncbi:MAG: hypothetical protein KA185_01800 [Vitreoscilla sp.]|nr:hypothetical protein [Vitreoscilla sp.]